MIITCTSCNKKFEINSNLIPENGRLLECSKCNNQWFFNPKKTTQEPNDNLNEIKLQPSNDLTKKQITKEKKTKTKETIDDPISLKPMWATKKNIDIKKKINNTSGSNILYLILVFLISIITFIIFIDTFKNPISSIIPNIEFILYNLYESIKDITLFFIDLL